MDTTNGPRGHWTTRRGFIAAAGFGGVSLYGLWAAYGAAPGPLVLLGLGHGDTPVPPAANVSGSAPAGAHGGAGHGAGHGTHGAPPQSVVTADAVDAEAFRAETERFIARYQRADGSVHPRRMPMQDPGAAPLDGHGGHAGGHAGHGHAADGHTAATTATAANATTALPEPGHDTAIEVPMLAGRWYYLPAALRLDAGQDYRFRLLTMDVSHGASIQFGRGARMLRLRPGRVTEVDLRFERPGRHLVTCTVYCGAAHDVMRATIEVV